MSVRYATRMIAGWGRGLRRIQVILLGLSVCVLFGFRYIYSLAFGKLCRLELMLFKGPSAELCGREGWRSRWPTDEPHCQLATLGD